MKLIDCFTFYNELKMLEFRLTELDDVVDYFILVEANKTYSGFEKEYYYDNNKHLFVKFNHKIIHIKVDDMPDGDGHNNIWARENHQRNCIIRGLEMLDLERCVF